MPEPIDQVDRNYDAFIAQLPGLLARHGGEYALLHDGGIINFYESAPTALIAGIERFGSGQFSVQEVTAECDNLGFYSYGGGAGQA